MGLINTDELLFIVIVTVGSETGLQLANLYEPLNTPLLQLLFSEIHLSEIGPKIENNIIFPNKINAEFVEKITDTYFKVKVWERGCGATLACGTGACAVYTCVRQDLMQEITLEFPGGNLYLSENTSGQIILRGPAICVFKGEI